MRNTYLGVAICLLCVLPLFSPAPTMADELLQADGALLIQGGQGCSPAPCTQTLDFSLNFLASASAATFFTPSANLLSATVTGAGPLGSGGSAGYGQTDSSGPGFTEFEAFLFTSSNDEIDLLFSLTQTGSNFAISAPTPFFYSCTSTGCVDAFIPPAFQSLGFCTTAFGCEAAQAANVQLVSYSDSATQVPEPPLRLTLLITLGVLLLVVSCSRMSFRRLSRLNVG
jgi:hypothetical protein